MNRLFRFSAIFVISAVSTFATGCSRTSPKSTGVSAASEENTYVVTLVLPGLASDLALTYNPVSFTSFDAEGNEVSNGSLEPSVSDGVALAELNVNPRYLYAIDGNGLGAVLSPTGDVPGTNIQVPMTTSGKNVADAFKSLPREYRSSFDVEAAHLLLPSGSKFDNLSMKDLMIALAEQGKSLPNDKRMELNLQRAKAQIDYIEVIKNSGNVEVAIVSASASASKVFLDSNPHLAENPIVKLIQRPADALTSTPALLEKLTPQLRIQVLDEALTRQIVSAIVASSDGKPFATPDLVSVTPILESIKSKYSAARALNDDFASMFIESVKSESFARDGKPKSFDPSGFSSIVMDAVKKSDGTGANFAAFENNLSRYNSDSPGCVEWRKKCTAGGLADPRAIAAKMQEGARILIDQLAKLPTQDKAILSCSAVATSNAISLATACAEGACLSNSVTEAYTDGAKAACAINKCLKSFIKNPTTEAMSMVCDVGKKVAAGIACHGFPGIGGGLGELCDTEIEAKKPPVLKECPYAPSAPACVSTGGPKTPDDIHTACVDLIQDYKDDIDFQLFQGNCLAKCESLTTAAASSCKVTSCPGGFELVNGSCVPSVGRTTVVFEGCDYLTSNSLNQESDLSAYGFPRSGRWRISGQGYFGAGTAIAVVRCEVDSPVSGLPELNLPAIMSDCVDRWGNTFQSQNQPRHVYRYDFDPNLSCP